VGRQPRNWLHLLKTILLVDGGRDKLIVGVLVFGDDYGFAQTV
jgi:hypothetical protein